METQPKQTQSQLQNHTKRKRDPSPKQRSASAPIDMPPPLSALKTSASSDTFQSLSTQYSIPFFKQAIAPPVINSVNESQEQPWTPDILNTMIESVKTTPNSYYKVTDSGKVIYTFNKEGERSTKQKHYAVIKNMDLHEIQTLHILDQHNVPVPAFKQCSNVVVMEWIDGLTVTFNQFLSFNPQAILPKLDIIFNSENKENCLHNLLTSLAILTTSSCSVGDLQLQISSQTGKAYIIDPQPTGLKLKENVNLHLFFSALKKE